MPDVELWGINSDVKLLRSRECMPSIPHDIMMNVKYLEVDGLKMERECAIDVARLVFIRTLRRNLKAINVQLAII